MSKLIKYLYFFHTLVMVIIGIGVWFIINQFFPDMMVNGFGVIPVFFYFMGIIFIWRFKKAPFHDSGYIVNLYMLLRMIKVFTSFAIILIYWLVHKSYIRNFAIIFIIFYLISILWETYIYLRMEKYMKYKADQNKHHEEREHIV